MTAVIAAAALRLEAAGVGSPEHDARALALHVLGLSRPSELAATTSALDRRRYEDLVDRRAARVPLQHLTGTAPFRYVELQVGPGVFVPRPETEWVVEWALSNLVGTRVVDLCTGSGAIAQAVATEMPGTQVWAVEKDPAAAAWAARNLSGVELVVGDVDGCLPDLDGTVDLVISNPPYVPVSAAPLLEPEVTEHDPALAVFGGVDGLDVIRVVERTARRLLRPGGLVVVEHDDAHGTSAPALFADGWHEVVDHDDLSGRPRFLSARLVPMNSASRVG